MELILFVVGLPLTLAVGIAVGYAVVPAIYTKRIDQLRDELRKLKEEEFGKAEKEAKLIVDSAKAEATAILRDADRTFRDRQREVERREKSILRMEEKLAQRLESIDRKQSELEKVKASLTAKEEEWGRKSKELDAEILRLSSLTREEARQMLFERVEQEMEYELDKRRRELALQAEQDAQTQARKVIVNALSRCSFDHYSDAIITTVDIKKEDMKGRIIGREGRNIRTLEQLTGVDVIIDDTPNVVVLSSFDPIRREVARLTLERLITDGRIHPAKIEEMVEKSKDELEELIWQAGQEAAFRTGITGIHPELIKLLGRLKFRTSFGQNILSHSIEVAHLSSAIALELGIDPKNAKRGGLLHDIGKAVDSQIEGTHQAIGMELAKKYGENPVVCNVIGAHHGDIEQTLEAAIVQSADAVSASRPGARGEALETYLKRLESLEAIGSSFPGVEKCYAIQAGRELRVFVEPDVIDDVVAFNICRKITKRIQEELDYPGMIKVTVIREVRETDYAK